MVCSHIGLYKPVIPLKANVEVICYQNQERLLRFAVLPVLMGSALQLQCSQHAMLSQETDGMAW